MPSRIQRKRTKGWRKPEGAIDICRPGRWGNPYQVVSCANGFVVVDDQGIPCSQIHGAKKDAIRQAIDLFRFYTIREIKCDVAYLEPLRGRNLMCWCKIGDPCHGDVLLELANQEAQNGS